MVATALTRRPGGAVAVEPPRPPSRATDQDVILTARHPGWSAKTAAPQKISEKLLPVVYKQVTLVTGVAVEIKL